MSIKRRIWTMPIISTVILAIGLSVSVYFTTDALQSLNKTENVDYPVLEQTKILGLEVSELVDGFKEAVAEGDKEQLIVLEKQAAKIKELINKLASKDSNNANYQLVNKEFDSYIKVTLVVSKKMMGVEEGDATPMIAQMQSSLKVLEEHLAKLNKDAQTKFNDGIHNSSANVKNVLITTVLVSVITSLILVVICYFVIRVIWHQLGGEPEYTREIARSISDGNLANDIVFDAKYSNSLLFAMTNMQKNLAEMINNIKVSSVTIKDAASEIATGNMDLSARTEAQAGSLEETASAIEELTSTVKQNADNAKVANNLVINSASIAIKGGEVVTNVISTMKDIDASSKKIADIISVIDGIAFQTNILALNAAVEAARAGEQGRGFAVVASEVRNLAQRSANAAKEIKLLISDSNDKVKTGSDLVDKAGKTMNEIVVSVQQVADLMSEISLASNEQSTGIEEVNKAINQMDKMTQQNAALVEESAAAAGIMQQQSELLVDSISVFKVSPTSQGIVKDVIKQSIKEVVKPTIKSVAKVIEPVKKPIVKKTVVSYSAPKKEVIYNDPKKEIITKPSRKALPDADDWEEF